MFNFRLQQRLKAMLQAVLWVLGFILAASVQAEDNPRYLNTDFDAFKKQQALHDQALMQAKTKAHAKTSHAQPATNPQALAAADAKQPSKKPKKPQNFAQSASTININQADEKMIMQSLNGIGAVKAKAIVDYRNSNGKFKQAQDLLLVKGIGAATLAKNQDLLRFD